MKTTLNLSIIEQVYPKVNYIVFWNNTLYKIIELDKEIVTLEDLETHIECKVAIENVIPNHVLFVMVGEYTTKTLLHSDIPKLIEQLKKHAKELDLSFSEFIFRIINNQHIEHVDCEIKLVYSRPNKGDTIEIINVNIIDDNQLYDKSSRICRIDDIETRDNKKDLIHVTSLSTNKNLKLLRSQFVIKNKRDNKELFKLK